MLKSLSTNISNVLSKKQTHKFVLYTLFKYLEYGITAFSFFYFANIVGPEKYGYATAGLLVITYSAFAVLGINQVLVKWHALSENKKGQSEIINYNIFYNLLFSLLLFGSIYSLLSSKTYSFQIAIIVSLKLCQECAVNINRVEQKIFNINAIYLSFGIILLIGTLFYVDNTDAFFTIWCYSLLISSFVGVMTIYAHLNIFAEFSNFRLWVWKNARKLFLDGVKFALIGAIPVFYLSIDRVLLINYTNISEEALGNYQLADNISAVITLGFNAILFIITPSILTKLHKKEIDPSYFFKLGYKIFFGILGVSFITGVVASSFIQQIFPDYDKITYPLIMFVINRSLFIGFFVYSNICIVSSKETLYVKLAYACFIFVILGYIIAMINTIDPQSLIYIFPPIVLTVILLLHFVYHWSIVKKYNFFKQTP